MLSSLTFSGGVNAIVEYANRLADNNHHIFVVVPGGMVDPVQQTKLRASVTVIQSKIPLSSQRNIVRFGAVSLSMARAVPPSDVLIATHTPTVIPMILAKIMHRTPHTIWLYMDYAEMFADRPVEQFLLKRAPAWFEKVLTISDAGRQSVEKNTGVRAEVLKLGISHPVTFDVPPHRHDTRIRILYIGDARPRKGLADFLRAAEIIHQKTIHPLRFIIVSKDELSLDTSLPHQFYHAPSLQELGELYQSADIFVSSSWAEGFGLPPLEAMAYGTPVVLTDSRGVRDFARDGENCLVVPPRTPDALADAILMLLNNPELAQMLGKNGMQTVTQYNWDDSVTEFEAILRSL